MDINEPAGPLRETPIHVATRRYRPRAVEILLDHGADINAKTAGGKTAYAHAVRRGFAELVQLLEARGADTELNQADLGGFRPNSREFAARLGRARIPLLRRRRERQDRYVALVRLLLDAGASVHHSEDPQGDSYLRRLLKDASPQVAEVLRSDL